MHSQYAGANRVYAHNPSACVAEIAVTPAITQFNRKQSFNPKVFPRAVSAAVNPIVVAMQIIESAAYAPQRAEYTEAVLANGEKAAAAHAPKAIAQTGAATGIFPAFFGRYSAAENIRSPMHPLRNASSR